jgi:hypothetical protein
MVSLGLGRVKRSLAALLVGSFSSSQVTENVLVRLEKWVRFAISLFAGHSVSFGRGRRV